MALTPEQRVRVEAGASVAAGLISSSDWWEAQNARQRQNPNAAPYQRTLAVDAMAIVDELEAIVTQ